MKIYDLRVWDRREHWYFYASIKAVDIVAAKVAALKDYPREDYTIADIREHH